ncbi:MAG: FprA family A-type flavoprotein, partial [Oscillospiraceae bacterium]
IPIFYTSAYGNTGQVAEYLKKGILSVIPDAKVDIFDLIDHDMTEMQHKLNTSDAFAVGSPTINKDAVPPIWNLLSHVDAVNGTKKP